ncbi:MAG: translation initiation factor IF-3 [Endomicrobium sp.]|jgi:translation initiation factor IF-3|nr:translation initiation factor IF-3 [Endomicrobium sp.]
MEGIVEKRKFCINQFIKAIDVRLIDSNGTMIGIVKTSDALVLAQSKSLDLVEISPRANPPICKIVSFAKFKYELNKKNKESIRKQKISHVKEIRIRSRIGCHDLEVKIRRARDFIINGDKVQITAMFSGREMQHKDLGVKVMNKMVAALSDVAELDGKISSIGTRVFLVLGPRKNKKE